MAAQKIENLITDHLDLWTAVVRPKSSAGRGSNSKLELTGIKKLRELILELAVRGKLVPQDPNDEPASVLLERIAAEKARLVKEKKIKKPKALPEIGEEEKPFELPEGWVWCRLNDIMNISSGDGLTSKQMAVDGGIPVFGGNGITGYHDQYNVSQPTLVIGRVGFYCGSVHITPENAWVTDNAFITTFSHLNIDIKFLFLLLKATDLNENDNATAQPVISGRKLYPIVVCLPPLSEQRSIVTKVDELMALCDQLEQQSGTHFDTLFTTEASIDALKQTILQLAVMGKLVPQDPCDEPASALLARIAAEKAQLVKEKKIKKEKPLPTISEDEKPFELPQGWEWCRFGALVNFRAELVKPEHFQSFDQVAPDSIEKGTGKLIKRRTVLESGVKGPNSRFYAGQILYSKIRPSLSKAIIAGFDGLCSADMYPLDAMISSDFLLKIILSEVFLAQVRVAENRIKMPKLNVDSLSNILVPVCPESEMNRITSKITDLILVCDKLQSRLQTSQQTQLALAESLVAGALA